MHAGGPAQVQKGQVALIAGYVGSPTPITTVTIGGAPAAITGPAYASAALLYDASGAVLAWRDDGAEKVMPTMGKILDPSGTPIGDAANPVVVTDAASAQAAAIVTADFYRIVNVASPGKQDFIAIDLNNDNGGGPGSGPYKHDETGAGVKIAWLSISIEKDEIIDTWDAKFGVITRVDVTSADITWLQDGFLRARTTLRHEESRTVDRAASVLDLTVDTNVLKDVSGSLTTLTDTTVKITDSFEVVDGSTANPADGDIILRVDHLTGAGELLVHYQFGYFAE